MANIKISQLTPKGANLDSNDLLEISEFNGSGYTTKSITGQEIIDAASGGTEWGDITGDLFNQTDLQAQLDSKQEYLFSGTNIKTINGSSLLGSGDLAISGGGGSAGIHTALKPGGSMFGGLETSNAISSYYGNTYTSQANQVIYCPYIPNQTFTSTQISIYANNSQSGGLAKLGIYSSDGFDQPNNKLYQSTDIDLSTNGNKTVLVNFSFTKGTIYWLALHTNVFNSQIFGLGYQGGALIIGFLTTSAILGWTNVTAPYSSGMPSTPGINSFQTIIPHFRIK